MLASDQENTTHQSQLDCDGLCHKSIDRRLNPFMPNGLSHLNSFDRFISYTRGVSLVFVISCFEEISKLNANSLDPDQTPHIAASDLGLRCLPMSLLWDARRKGVRLPRPFIQSSLYQANMSEKLR